MEDDKESGLSAAVALSMEEWALEKDRLQALSLDVALEEEEIEQALRLSSITADGFSDGNQEEVGGDDLDHAMSLSAVQEHMRVKSEEQLEEEIAEAIARSLGLNERESEDDEICLICHTDALSALPSILLACGHKFHEECCRFNINICLSSFPDLSLILFPFSELVISFLLILVDLHI